LELSTPYPLLHSFHTRRSSDLDPDGFIPDDIFRNNQYEENNYRDTKPPLSAWAVWEIYTADGGRSFLEEMYPKLIKQHKWWYVRSEEHTSELQSRFDLVCRLLL